MKEKEASIKLTPGSGNVFADMALDNPEERLLKAKLARLVNKVIARNNWTQTTAAQVLGITQPDVSALSRGRLKNFSVERLLLFLSRLERRITITVSSEADNMAPEEIIIAPYSEVSAVP